MAKSSKRVPTGGASSRRAAGDVSGLAARGQGVAGSGHRGETRDCPKSFRVGSLNVGTMRGKGSEVAEMLTRRRTDLCWLQEVRRKNAGAALVVGKRSRYKFFWNGNEDGTGGVGVMLAEKRWENVFAVDRVSDRILLVRMNIDKVVFAFVCVYAPQINLKAVEKDRFYDALQTIVTKVPGSEQLFICGDLNGHVGADSMGYSEVHGGYGYGLRNPEGERILELCVANDLLVGNSWYQKKPLHLVTYQSGEDATQVDYILFRRAFKKKVNNVKVIAGEECAPQHRLVVADFTVVSPSLPKRKFEPRLKVWKLRAPEKQVEFAERFKANFETSSTEGAGTNVEELWSALKGNLLKTTKEVCGTSTKHQWRKQTWWWNNVVDNAIKEKRKCYKAWKAGGSREAYNAAKRVSNRAVFHAKNEAQKAALDDIDFKSPDIFRLAKQLKKDKLDVVGEKPVKNDEGVLSLDDKSKKSAWKEHYERLLNVEFDWNPDELSEEKPVEEPSEPITDELIAKAVAKMSKRKAAMLK